MARLYLFLLASCVFFGSATSPNAETAACLPPKCTAFPADAGALNVRDFGAKGDGVADDTAALNAALTASGDDTGPAFWQDRIVYLPDGTYLVSGPIAKRYKNGGFGSGAILIGQSRDKTIIRLKDGTPGYGDKNQPRAVIFTASKLLDGGATGGGKDYTNRGEGNDAFMNFVENLTVDVGANNAGAIGIDYLANNQGAVRNVRVRAQNGSGATGIALTRKWPGPALLKDVSVEGFDTGIDVDSTEYGMTMESIRLSGQRVRGLRNNHNMVAIRDLTIQDAPLPLSNLSPDGLVVVIGGKIQSKLPREEAIHNEGYMNLRDVQLSGYKTALDAAEPLSLDGIYEKEKRQSPSSVAWKLPIKNVPPIIADAAETWKSVAAFGAKADTGEDVTEALRKAFNSGASTIYFPHGIYHISDNITVPHTVQLIVGMNSTIRAHPSRVAAFKREHGMFRAASRKTALTIEKLAFDHSNLGDQVAVEAGKGVLVLRDIVGAGVTTLSRPEQAGEVHIENTCCGKLALAGENGVWARQLNTEGVETRIRNSGSPLWILGLKTEQNTIAVENTNGAVTEVLGGLIYITGNSANPAVPAFRNTDSKMLLSYVEESFDVRSTYQVHLQDSKQGDIKVTKAEELPLRTIGRIVPQLISR